MDSRPVSPIPSGAVLAHVGMPKTGTTAIQMALTAARDKLVEHGVVYPGNRHNHSAASFAIAGRVHGWRGALDDDPQQGDGPWRTLVDEVGKSPDARVVLSHEYFAELSPTEARRFVTDLGRPVHVVFTLRNQAGLLSSSWQQTLKGGQRRTFANWLRESFGESPHKGRLGRLWRRLQLADLVEKWAAIVGAENITLIVVDKTDRQRLYRTFEELLGLPHGSLPEDGDGQTSNRSMTAVEAAFFRNANASMAQTDERSRDLFVRLYRRGAINRILATRIPPPDEARILPPQWAVDRVVDLTQTHVSRIKQLGVSVIGDLDVLSAPVPADPHDDPIEPEAIPVTLAATVASGMLEASYEVERERRDAERRTRRRRKAKDSTGRASAPQQGVVGRFRRALYRQLRRK